MWNASGSNTPRRRWKPWTSSATTVTVLAALLGAGASDISGSSAATAAAPTVSDEFDDGVIVLDSETGEPFQDRPGARNLAIAADSGYVLKSGAATHAYTFTVKLVESPRAEGYRAVLQQVANQLRASGFADLTIAPGYAAQGNYPLEHEIYFRTEDTTYCGGTSIGCALQYAIRRADDVTKTALRGEIWVLPVVDASAQKLNVVAHEIGHILGLDHYDNVFENSYQVMHSRASIGGAPFQSGDRAGLSYVAHDAKPVGTVEPVTLSGGKVRVTGWAFDPDQFDAATIRVTVDGQTVAEKATDVYRDDVHAANPTLETRLNLPRGFDVSADAKDGLHRVCVSVKNFPRADFAPIGCTDIGLTTDRIQGNDRFESAAAVARAAYPGAAPVVVVASGETFPDALSAGPAASVMGGPLLLTGSSVLPASTKAEIARLKPSKIYIVGGPAAISTDVETQLKNLVSSTVRLSGSDRFETSRIVAQEVFGTTSKAFVASGNTFPDALTVGAAAASARAPMVLVGSAPSPVDKTTADLLSAMGATSVRVAGGTAVVADASVATITASIGDTRRMSGTDRFLTADAISTSEFSPTTSHAYIVNGMNFPDGLVTAPLAATTKSPIYLGMGDCIPQPVFTELTRLGVTNLTLVGGPTVLTSAVESLRRCS